MADDTTPSEAPPPALERRLATILAADVAGYSRMMGENEEATVQTMRGHRAVFDALLKQHHGRVFNTAGDMILAEFPSAVEAVRCATEVQAALRTRNEHLAPERQMVFRMGINLGDVVVQDGDLLGDGVNVAARIQTIAEPGGICISASVYDQILNKLSLQFTPLGERNFKNIGQPIRTFSIASGDGTGARRAAPKADGRAIKFGAVGALALAIVAAGGYWLYREGEERRVEQAQMAAMLAAQKKAADEAKQALDEQSKRTAEAERKAADERAAAEAAKRETALKAQAQSSDDARKRAEADRERLAQELEQSKTAKSAAASAARSAPGHKTAVAANVAGSPAPSGAANGSVDGTYEGVLCNLPANTGKRTCWPVPLKIVNGEGTGTWTARATHNTATVHATIAADGNARATVEGFKLADGSPVSAAMNGHLTDDHIDLSGRWATGMRVDAHWTRTH